MGFDLDRLTDGVKAGLEKQRFLHTLGVVQTAVILADLHGVDVSRAAVAAVLHDCAKHLRIEQLVEMAKGNGLVSQSLEFSFPGMLHAPVGAWIAREQYGIEDKEILDAIYYHPSGRANPSPILLVLLAADYCEPTRDFAGVDELRELVRQDLRSGVVEILRRKAAHVQAKAKAVHPRIHETLRSLEAKGFGQGVK